MHSVMVFGEEGFAMVISEDERSVETRRKMRGAEVQERRNDDATRHPERLRLCTQTGHR